MFQVFRKFQMIATVFVVCGFARASERAYAPFWYLDAGTDATLEIASNSSEVLTFTPILMLRGTVPFPLQPVTLQPHDTVRIPLRPALGARIGSAGTRERTRLSFDRLGRWGDGSRENSMWGSAILEGEQFGAVYAWILSENREAGISINSMVSGHGRSAPELLAMWWRPSSNTRVLMSLKSTAQQPITVDTLVFVEGEQRPGISIELGPECARLIRPEELLELTGDQKMPQIGAVSFKVRDGEPNLQGWTILADETQGFSTPLSMQAPGSRSSTKSQMTGALIGELPEEMSGSDRPYFHPQLLLTNTENSPKDVFLTMRTDEVSPELSTVEGPSGPEPVNTQVVFEVPPIALAPFESRLVNLAEVRARYGADFPDGFLSIELDHNGQASGLFSEVLTVDESLRYAFHDPFMDLERAPVVMTAVSFDLGGDRHKVIVVKNTRDLPNAFALVLRYRHHGEDQTYMAFGHLGSQGTFSVDIRKLRDEAIADAYGTVIPKDVVFGHIMIRPREPGIIAGDLAFDGSSSFASCFDPCECDPPGFWCQPVKRGSSEKMLILCLDDNPFPTPVNYTFKYTLMSNNGSYCTYWRCGANNSGCNVPFTLNVTNQPGTSCPASGYQITYSVQVSQGVTICSAGNYSPLSTRPCDFTKQ